MCSKSRLYVEKLHKAHTRTFPLWVCLIWASHPFHDPSTLSLFGQTHFLFHLSNITTGSSDYMSSSFLIPKGDGVAVWAWYKSIGIPICIGGGVGVSVGMTFPFRARKSWGRSPGPASIHGSSNAAHPLPTVRCPSLSILCPAATVLITESKTNSN